MSDDSEALLLDDRLAPPMTNGEVCFEAPWQGRVFGMARALTEAGHCSWDEFRAHLIAEIGAWETSSGGSEYRYFDHFLAALTAILVDKGLIAPGHLEDRFSAFARRPHGHDH